MKRWESKRPRARVLSAVLAVCLGWAAGGEAAEPGGDAQPEGIKVHGHWTIDVRNPDGSLASHHEVENALYGGQGLLAGLLSNYYSDPIWSIELWGSPALPCLPEGSLGGWPCTITEPRWPASGRPYSKNLTVGAPVDPAAVDYFRLLGTLELSGSATVAQDTSLNMVYTVWHVVARNHSDAFSRKQLSPTIPVRQGQIVQVKIVFSFS